MRTLEELIEDHKDELRVMAHDWNEHCSQCVWRAWLHGVIFGVISGTVLSIFVLYGFLQ